MKCKAYAKINLCLDVVGKREDGYHELDMIMMPLELHDEITIELAKEDVYSCNIEGLVMDETNTVVKSVELMRKTFGLKEHFHVHVEKIFQLKQDLQEAVQMVQLYFEQFASYVMLILR